MSKKGLTPFQKQKRHAEVPGNTGSSEDQVESRLRGARNRLGRKVGAVALGVVLTAAVGTEALDDVPVFKQVKAVAGIVAEGVAGVSDHMSNIGDNPTQEQVDIWQEFYAGLMNGTDPGDMPPGVGAEHLDANAIRAELGQPSGE